MSVVEADKPALTVAQRIRVAVAINGRLDLRLDRDQALALMRLLEAAEAQLRTQEAADRWHAIALKRNREMRVWRRTAWACMIGCWIAVALSVGVWR